MSGDDGGHRQMSLRSRFVQGEPYYLAGHTLTPVARVVSWGKASGTIGADRIVGWGGGLVRVTPLAVVVATGEEEQRIVIRDATGAALKRLYLTAFAVTLFLTTVRWWIRRRRQTHADEGPQSIGLEGRNEVCL